MLTALHSIGADSLNQVLSHGLRYGEAGSRSKEPSVDQANSYLDAHRPKDLERKGVSRNSCIYMYVELHGFVLDIKDGALKHPSQWNAGEGYRKLRATIDEEVCFVSNLDAYDAFVASLTIGDEHQLVEKAKIYWQSVVPFTDFLRKHRLPPTTPRIELMVTKTIQPSQLTLIA